MVRFKNRWILCEVISNGRYKWNVRQPELYTCVREILQKIHGDYGVGLLKSSLGVKYWNPETHMLILRAKRGPHILLQSALPFITKIGQQDAFLKTLHLGGTIRSCQKYLMKYHRQKLPELMKYADEEGKDEIQKYIKKAKTSIKKGRKRTSGKSPSPVSVEPVEDEIDTD